jgi:hypothetical protein
MLGSIYEIRIAKVTLPNREKSHGQMRQILEEESVVISSDINFKGNQSHLS